MALSSISFQVDTDLASYYNSSSKKEQKKLQHLFNIILHQYYERSISLSSLMDEISEKAQSRGLTAKKLEKLLNE